MKLINVTRQFATEDACLNYLERMRWPNGVCCIGCGSLKVQRLKLNIRPTGKANPRSSKRATLRAKSRRVYQCLERECLHQFTATSGTVFHKTHLPLNVWFMAIAMICEAKKGMSANQLKRHLGVNYRTAWFLVHRIREAMIELSPKPLSGDVEFDETYLGGKKRKQGYLRNKRMILGAVQRGGQLRLRFEDRAKQPSQQIAREWVAATIAPDTQRLLTDAHPAYFGLGQGKHKHESVNHIAFEWVRGDVHTNTIENVWSLLKRAVIGTYHKVSIKHLQRYLEEFTYRFNRRGQQPEMFAETVQELLRRIQLPYKKLTAEAEVV